MANGCGSPCGACKFLRRKCVRGCVFSPYFSHENGASHFAAIHKVFGASNVSKLLAHLPVSDRSEAAVTISYEAQARIHDPIYGCVSHIFALQQQVVSLQAQLASLKEQAGQSNSNHNPNPNSQLAQQDHLQNWYHHQTHGDSIPTFHQNPYNNRVQSYEENGSSLRSSNSPLSDQKDNTFFSEYYNTFSSLDVHEQSQMRQWSSIENSDDLHSAMSGYNIQLS